MITARLVVSLGLSQLVCWGVSYYPIGVFGEQMARDLGWSMTLTYSGFSVALVVMGVASAFAGRLIDRYGGRRVMVGGSLLLAVGCLCLSRSHDLFSYSMSWACLGLAMRLTLYEAAFAALARIGGRSARRAISQITLLRWPCLDSFLARRPCPRARNRLAQHPRRLRGLRPPDGTAALVDP